MIKMTNKFIIISLLTLLSTRLTAQIIPPGLGKTNTSSWLALGFKQDLDTLAIGGWESTTYIGLGTVSHAHQSNPFEDVGIWVINQEFYHNFAKNWQYSLALSYRQQNLFSSTLPFKRLEPRYKQEFRWYGRLSYAFKFDNFTITPTFRQEVIKYFTPSFDNYDESWRIRSRFRLKFALPLTPDKSQQLLLYSEQLFSISQNGNTKKWDHFSYADSRFALYYSLKPKSHPLTYNLGYMHNLIGTQDTFSGHYFALDIIWKNPFS